MSDSANIDSNAALGPTAGRPASERDETAIQDMAAWVLRIGVLTSVLIMLVGVIVSGLHGMPSVQAMRHVSFNDHFTQLLGGLLRGDGASIINTGILLLVLTPIIRVAVSMVLFVVIDRDWFYAAVTLIVFLLTLSSLLFLEHI